MPPRLPMWVVAAGTCVAMGALFARVRYVNPYNLRIERVDVAISKRAMGLLGMRIGFLADFHVGPFFSFADALEAIELLIAEKPDLVMLGGDYVSESVRYLGAMEHGFALLGECAPMGAFAVLGNHDLSLSRTKVSDALQQSGIRVLCNESVRIERGGEPFWIVGIDDSLHGHPDLDKAFDAVPDSEPAIALWHEPAFAEQSADRGAVLQLSGHAHGGQVRFPYLQPRWVPPHSRPHTSGLSVAGGMPVYTSRGVGVYRPPVRLNCPPEVSILTLR